MKWLIDGHIGHATNDLVVRFDSSAPAWVAKSRRLVAACDHQSYFASSCPSDYAAPLKVLVDWMRWTRWTQVARVALSDAHSHKRAFAESDL